MLENKVKFRKVNSFLPVSFEAGLEVCQNKNKQTMKKLFYILVLVTGISSAQIVNIPDANFKAKLIALGTDTNTDGEIQESEAAAYWSNALEVSNSNITDLTGIKSFTNIGVLQCSNNQLTVLDLVDMDHLGSVDCRNNLLTEILLGNNHIFDLDCSNNQLAEFNINGPNVQLLTIMYNPLLTSLDLSSATTLYEVFIAGTPLLEFLNVKNGHHVQVNFGGTMPALRHVCCEDQYVVQQYNDLITFGYVNATASSYCSFEPGGNHNAINGTITFDANNNGCDSNDIFQPNIRVNIDDATNSGASFTNYSGNYAFYVLTGSFTITPSIENPTWYNFSPATATIPFANNNNNAVTQNFCITANGIHPDVEVVIAPAGRARPGFETFYKVVIKNKGNQTVSGNVTFTYDDSILDFVSSDVTPTLQSSGLLGFDYTNLLPFENRSFYITLHVNAPTDTPAVNIGDQLNFSATVDPIDADENPSDNEFQYNQTVVGSLDPNDITCIEGNMVLPSEIGNYLHYIINFENTGTADAENVVVRDVIDTTQFDVNSLQLMNSSSPVTARLTGNVAEFIFQNVNLHSGGHGNILIKVKSKNTLVQGNTVSKKASIYFDYNAPVDTNLENTTFQALSNPDYEVDASISVYPNPTKGNVTINCSNTIQSVQLFDVQGRLLQTDLINQNNTVIDITGKANGVYFLKVTSEKGIIVQKIVKN